MAQQKIYNFGDLLTQGRTKTLASKLFAPGVYEGMQPTILSSALLSIQPGAFLLPNGVLVTENADVADIEYPTPWPPSVATDYTLTADHADTQAIGGSPVSYTIRPGLLARSGAPSTNSLALLWIRHPGSAPLAASMFSTPAPVKVSNTQDDLANATGWLRAPFIHACDLVAGPNIQQQNTSHYSGPHRTGLLVVNSAMSGQQTLQFSLPLPQFPRPRAIEVYADLPLLGSIGFNTVAPTTTVPAVAGTAVSVTMTSTSGFSVNDKISFYDAAAPVREVTSVSSVTSPTQLVVSALLNAYPIGSVVRSLSVVTADDGSYVAATPSIVSGPATGLDSTPVATLVLASTEPVPVTLGVKVVVPPGGVGTAVFIKGFRIISD